MNVMNVNRTCPRVGLGCLTQLHTNRANVVVKLLCFGMTSERSRHAAGNILLRSISAQRPAVGYAPATGLLVILAIVTGCVNMVDASLFQPQPVSAMQHRWTSRPPVSVTARTADGLALSGWFWPPLDPSGDIVLFLPGRAGNRDIAAAQAEPFAADGRGVLVASYRGYGSNLGKPSEKGLYLDGAAFADLARTLRGTGRLYLFGDGLGSAVALRTAARADVSGTVTLGAFDRFSSFAPPALRAFYSNAFDNVAAIRRVKTPVVLMHGRKDQVVPIAAAEVLRQAAGGTAIVAPIDGDAYHSVDLKFVAPTAWRAFDQMGVMTRRPPAK